MLHFQLIAAVYLVDWTGLTSLLPSRPFPDVSVAWELYIFKCYVKPSLFFIPIKYDVTGSGSPKDKPISPSLSLCALPPGLGFYPVLSEIIWSVLKQAPFPSDLGILM